MSLFHRYVVVFQFAFKKGTKINDLIPFYTYKYFSQMNYVAIYGKKRQKTQKNRCFLFVGEVR